MVLPTDPHSASLDVLRRTNDALFANAGVSAGLGALVTPQGGVDKFDLDIYQRAIDINLTSTIMAMRFAVPHMKRRKSGSIVLTASIAGIKAEPFCGYGYVAAKAAIINVGRQAAVELAPFNIRVNSIAPGPFLTNIGVPGGSARSITSQASRIMRSMINLAGSTALMLAEHSPAVRQAQSRSASNARVGRMAL